MLLEKLFKSEVSVSAHCLSTFRSSNRKKPQKLSLWEMGMISVDRIFSLLINFSIGEFDLTSERIRERNFLFSRSGIYSANAIKGTLCLFEVLINTFSLPEFHSYSCEVI